MSRVFCVDELYHHGILKQKWGVRNGPPYPLSGGDYTPQEKKAMYTQRRRGNSIYNKKHFDDVIKADNKTRISTLSYDKDRTKNTDMFYATYKNLDKHQYNALFNKPIPKELYDENGNSIGTGQFLKYRIDNKAKSDIKVASEDSSINIFADLYKKDRDFYNFVNDDDRMQKYFVDDKYKFKGYREARESLRKMDSPGYKPSYDDISKVYRMFNYVIPYDGAGADNIGKKDVATQRAKFFSSLKKAGYGAVLDTNDAIYGGFKASSPVIVFDMGQVVPDSVYQTKMSDKYVSSAMLAGRKFLGI